MENAEPMALGVMRISVQDFENMTPSDFLTALKGFNWMREREQKDRAHVLANIIGTCGHLKRGKKVRMQDFYTEAHLDPRNPFYRQLLGI